MVLTILIILFYNRKAGVKVVRLQKRQNKYIWEISLKKIFTYTDTYPHEDILF